MEAPINKYNRKRAELTAEYKRQRKERLERILRELIETAEPLGIKVTPPSKPTLMRNIASCLACELRRRLGWVPPNIYLQSDLSMVDCFVPKIPAKPTRTVPGSPERIEVYVRRLEAGEELWHPDDTCEEMKPIPFSERRGKKKKRP
jgi:hypothetical protein